MTVQVKKTYRGINPEMLYDEIRGLVEKQGVTASEENLQTYSLPSGATQSRVATVFQTKDKKKCGGAHIIGSPGGETRMTLDLDEELLSKEKISVLQEELAFILGSYEVRW